MSSVEKGQASGSLVTDSRRSAKNVETGLVESVFPGEGELAGLMRAFDWGGTPLGAVKTWPQSLKTSVSICLASRFPIVLYWGSEYVVLYNDSYSQILGTKHPWALGQTCRICWAEIWDTIGPMLNSVVRTGKATWSDDLLLRLQRFGYSEECYFSFSFSPVLVESGVVGGIFTAVIETTEKVIGERRLRTLRDLAARTVAAKSEDDVWRIAANTLGENDKDVPFAVLCSLSEDGLQIKGTSGIESGNPFCELLGRPDSELTLKAMQVARLGVNAELNELNALTHDLPGGPWETAPHTALLLPIAVSGQGPAAVLVAAISPAKSLDDSYRTFFDLLVRQIATSIADARSYEGERKRAESLAELDRAKTLFFSNISHELRTPLTLSLGPTESALSSHGALKGADLEIVHRNQLRLLKLVNTLLDFSRIEAGRVKAVYEPTNLGSLTVEIASMFHSAMERAGLKFTVRCEELGETVYVDREMWEKIVLNLLSNAFKYTFEGEVALVLRSTGGAVEMIVRDTGIGIPEDQLPRVFERFHRVESTRARTHEGTGIGLALVHELVRLHGGTVTVESREDHGSTFVVTIPKGTVHLPSGQIQTQPTTQSAVLKGHFYAEEAFHWLADEDGVEVRADSSAVHEEPREAVEKHGGKDRDTVLVVVESEHGGRLPSRQTVTVRPTFLPNTMLGGSSIASRGWWLVCTGHSSHAAGS